MRESSAHDDDSTGEESAATESRGPESAAPFGFGVDPWGASPTERGSAAVEDASKDSSPTRPRSTRFRCALRRLWERSSASDLDRALDLVTADAEASPLVGETSRGHRSLPPFDASDLDEALESFDEDGRIAAGRAHLCVDVASLEPLIATMAAAGRGSIAGAQEGAHAPMLVRLDVHEPAQAQVRRILAPLFEGRGVVVLSAPELPSQASTIVAWVHEAWPGAPLELLHDDGLECVRAAATRTDVAAQIVAPQAHFQQQLRSLQRSRVLLAEARDEELRAAHEGLAPGDAAPVGHFGSGVVGPPLPAFEFISEVPAPFVVTADGEPDEAARRVVDGAFGPAVLGGYSTVAVSRVLVAQSVFSRFTEALLERLDAVERDPCFDPPFWQFSSGQGDADVLFAARRLGLDEGATLIFERSAADESGTPYGLVFTNGEPRMRMGHDARALGALLLMRGDVGKRVSH